MDSASGNGLRVAMFAPWQEQCGIRDYTTFLIKALDGLPEIATTRIVSAPNDSARNTLGAALSHYLDDSRKFRMLGDAMNAGGDIAHIQHQYFEFGGVAPYKTHIGSFLSSIAIPTVMTVHEIAAEPPGWVERTAVRMANRMNFGNPAVRALIVHTEADRTKLLQLGRRERDVILIRHPVPPAQPLPTPGATRRALEQKYPKLAGRRIVTLFGFLSAKKGHRVALEALSLIRNDVALVFAGGKHPDDHTDYVTKVESKIDSLGLRDRMVVTGYLAANEIPEIMAATDVAIAPFLDSSGSGSLANLLAYGRAIVASDIEPHRELDREAPGMLSIVPPIDAGRLASEIAVLLDSESRREELQQAALGYAASHTYLDMARDTVRVYDAVLHV